MKRVDASLITRRGSGTGSLVDSSTERNVAKSRLLQGAGADCGTGAAAVAARATVTFRLGRRAAGRVASVMAARGAVAELTACIMVLRRRASEDNVSEPTREAQRVHLLLCHCS
eukprot:352987-Chlamydomonas_euryale.AAC.14